MKTLAEQNNIYLNRRLDDLKKLFEEVGSEEFEFSQMLGHKLKGHGETFGFPDISKFGSPLEEASKNKNKALVLELSHELLSLVKKHLGKN